MNIVIEFLNSIRPLSPKLRDALKELLKKREMSAGEYTLREGDVCNRICFIETGLFCVSHEADKNDVITWLMMPGDVFISVRSFFKQIPSCENIRALEESVIWCLRHEDYIYLKENFPEFDTIRGDLLEHYYQIAEQRQYVTFSQSAKRRCQLFFEQFSDLAKIIPDKLAASYLGMNPSTFCRSKKRFFREQVNKRSIK